MEIPLPVLILVQVEDLCCVLPVGVVLSCVSGTASTALICSFIFVPRLNVLGAWRAFSFSAKGLHLEPGGPPPHWSSTSYEIKNMWTVRTLGGTLK